MKLASRVGHSMLAIALSIGTCTQLIAQTTGTKQDLSHAVPFEIGDTYFLRGDSITIDRIEGPTEAIALGKVYRVSGTYKLTSHPDAVLSSNVSSRKPIGPTTNHDPVTEPRKVAIMQGEGRFSVYLHMETGGYPHISFYPTGGGSSFAGIYFGSGDTLLKPRSHPGTTSSGTDTVTKN